MSTEIDKSLRGEWTSASSAAADHHCAGRFQAQKGLPDNETKASEFGTNIHAALAKKDPAGLTVEEADIYESCVKIEAKMVAQFFGVSEEEAAAAKPFRHQRYWVHWKDELRHSGELDCAYRRQTKALIVEYKCLAGEVAGSPRNFQLRDQAVLFDHNNPLLNEVGCVVIQPLVTHSPQICVYQRADLTRSMKEMHDRVAASHDPNAKRVPGETQCKYCKAATAGKCEEYNKWAGATVTVDPHLLDTPVANWTPAQCQIFCERLPIAIKWLEDAKEAMKTRLEADANAIPGFTLKEGNNMETIINPQAVFELFSQRGGSLNDFMQCIKVGKTDLKEALGRITKAKGKKLDAELEAVIGENHTFKRNAPSLAEVKEVK